MIKVQKQIGNKVKMDSEMMKKQTLKWCENVPRSKLNVKNMVMVIGKDGRVSFCPRHLADM